MYRLNYLNEHYFASINTSAKAYILGLIFSDGSIETGDKQHKQYRLRFSLQAKDIEMLEFIKSKLRYSGNIRVVDKYCYLDIHSKALITDLCRYGLMNNKSLILKPPKNLPKKYFGAFVRGFFDGDGCAALYVRGTYLKPYMVIVGTQSMMLWLRGLIKSKLKLRKQFNSWVLNVGGFEDIKRFIALMKCPYGLNRKTIAIRKIAAYVKKFHR
jgi:intein-encoded DNA endonuclease-like protein